MLSETWIRNAVRRLISCPIPPTPVDHALKWVWANRVRRAGIRVYAPKGPAYPEVTGYYIPTLLEYGQHELALEFTRWLVSIQNADGSWPDYWGKRAYTFDTGQVLRGLVAIFPRYPQAESAIRRGCDWMLTQMRKDGSITTPDTGAWQMGDGTMVSDAIYLYTLEPMQRAGKRFDEPWYREFVERGLNHYLTRPDLVDFGSLTHFHAYVLEALVDLGCTEAANRGMDQVERLQREDGSVPAKAGANWVCSTGLAQYSVIAYKLGRKNFGDRAMEWLRENQNHSGGFYGGYGAGADYFPQQEISWAVKYFLDASLWQIRCAFDATAESFPGSLDPDDGRLLAVMEGMGDPGITRILDAGCGNGRYAQAVQSHQPGAEVWGVDLSETMLRAVPGSIKTRQGSLTNLPFPDSYFDAAFCVEALEHSPCPQAAVRELCRVVKPGGSVTIVDKNIERPYSLRREIWERWFGRKEVERWLKPFCAGVKSQFIGYNHHPKPDGLFICWKGVRY